MPELVHATGCLPNAARSAVVYTPSAPEFGWGWGDYTFWTAEAFLSAYGALDREETTLEADAFCRGLYPKLVGSLRLAFGAQVAAEDLAQDALVRTIECWDAVAAMDHPEAWCYRVAFNLARSGFRRHQAESRATARLGARRPHDDDPPEPDDVLAVRAALAHLPRRQRQAIVLRFYADLTVDQVAESMKCRPGTVKAHLHQGLVALRHAGLTGDGLSDEDRRVPDRTDVGPTGETSRDSTDVPSSVERPARVRRSRATAPPFEQDGAGDE